MKKIEKPPKLRFNACSVRFLDYIHIQIVKKGMKWCLIHKILRCFKMSKLFIPHFISLYKDYFCDY